MPKSKFAHIADVDIHTLETIYADGRAMGRLVQDFKDDRDEARRENGELHTEIATLKFKLRRVTQLYEKLVKQLGLTSELPRPKKKRGA